MVWFATQHGLHLYDGLEIKVFSNTPESRIRLPSQIITSIAEDAQQRIWVTTAKGLAVIDANYHQLIPLNKLGIPDSIGTIYNCMLSQYADGQIMLLADKHLYTITANGLKKWCTTRIMLSNVEQFVFDAKRNQAYFLTILGPIRYGTISPNGEIKSLDAIVRWPQKEVTSLQYLWRTLTTEFGDSVSLLVSGKNSLGGDCRLMQYSQKSGQMQYETAGYYEELQPIWKIVSDTLSKQPALIQAQLLTSFFLRHATRDKSGNWWFSTTFGVIRVSKRQVYFRHLAFSQYRSMRGMIQTRRNAFILGGYNDVLYYPMPSGPLRKLDHLALAWWFYPVGRDTFITGLERQNGLWMIHEQPDGHLEAFLPNPEWKRVAFAFCAAPMKKGLWIPDSRHRLLYLRYSDNALIPAPLSLTQSLAGNIRAMHYSPVSGLWVASTSGLHLFRINPETEQIESAGTSLLPLTLQAQIVNGFCETSDGNLWLATSGSGLLQWTPATQLLQQFTKKNGLPHDHIYSLLPSHQGTVLWMGTQNGLCRFDRIKSACQNYYAADGLEQSEFNTGAAYHAANGIYYFGGINGISYFDPALIPAAPENPPAIVTKCNILNPKYVLNTIYPCNGSVLVLQPEENYFDIQFHVDQVSGINTAFRYQITGIHQDWQIGNAGEQIAFNTLAPGQYQLQVDIQNSNGNWISAYTLKIEILPTWYETIWSKLLAFALIAGSLFGLYHVRAQYKAHNYALRKQISDDLNDDLGPRLYLIKQLIGKINRQQGKEDLSQQLNQLDEQARSTLQSVNNFVWVYAPQNDHIQNFADRLVNFAEHSVRPSVQQFSISTTISNPELKTTPHQRHRMLQVYQELLTNIINHTLKPDLSIDINISRNQIQVLIVNQHQGKQTRFAKEAGITNESMHRSIQSAGGQLLIQSEANQQIFKLVLSNL